MKYAPEPPSPKVAAGGGIGAPLTVLVVWTLGLALNDEIPAVVAGAMGNLIGVLVAYYFPEGLRGDQPG